MAFWTELVITTSGGGGVTILLPVSGSVDGSNTQFIFSKKPSVIMINTYGYRVGNGWTWDSILSTATLDFAPQIPGDVWGFI